MAADEHDKDVTYGNWRRPASPGLGPLGTAGTVILLGGLAATVIAMMLSLLAGAVVAGVAICALVPLVIRGPDGRTLLQEMVARAAWERGRLRGQHIYRAGPLGRAADSFRLPGLAAASSVHDARDSYGRDFGLIEVPATGHYSAVFECSGDGAALVDQAQVDTWVAYWGSWLSALTYEPSLAAAAVSVETCPDSGTRLAGEVAASLHRSAPPLARQVLEQVVREYPAGSAQIAARVAVTYAAAPRPGARRRDWEEMTRDVGSRLPGLSARLSMTGAGQARPMAASELAEMVRIAYDPTVHGLIDRARAAGGSGLTWADAGPAMAQEMVGHYLHDSAASITWAMSEAPRGEVLSSVLQGLLAPHPDIARKRVTLLYRPHQPADASRIVERDRRDARFRLGRRTVLARDTIGVDAADQSAREEARGAGVVRFALLVTATVTRPDDLPAAAAAIDALAPPARLRLRRMYGSQAAAFAAALPIGIVLPDHVLVPQAIRNLS